MEQKQHSLHMTDRKKLDVTDVGAVDSMTDTQVVVSLSDTKLVVRGRGLSVNLLDVESGKLSLTGEIISQLEYTSGKREKFSFAKLFK